MCMKMKRREGRVTIDEGRGGRVLCLGCLTYQQLVKCTSGRDLP